MKFSCIDTIILIFLEVNLDEMVELTVEEFEELADQMEQEAKDNSLCTIDNHDGNFGSNIIWKTNEKQLLIFI